MPNQRHLEALQRIKRLTRRVDDPSSYLHGRAVGSPILPSNILCFVRRWAEALSMRLRSRDQHHRFVLIAALDGGGQICIDSEVRSLRAGQAQLIFPFQFHSYLSIIPSRIHWIFLTFEMERAHEIESLRCSPSRDLKIAELTLLSEIVRDWNSSQRHHFLPHRLAMLLASLRAHKAPRLTGGSKGSVAFGDNILTEVNRHVLARLDQPVTLKTVAARLGQSESNLRRRFRLTTGYSLGYYLRELRLQRACQLLHDTLLSIGEIAAKCGFDSIYSFSRTFKNGLGVSPRTYRQSLRPDPGSGVAEIGF